ncbi:MAG: hypothetical protein PS018_10855 [bacterium]|nr:hypothetical protein [bacterium]
METSVQIHCKRCKHVFRERARRLLSGFSRQCPSCEVVIFFDESSGDDNIRRTMIAARRMRAAIRDAEAERAQAIASRNAAHTYGGKRARSGRESSQEADDDV